VTEVEWLETEDLERLLAVVKNRASERKSRLYFCAGCRLCWEYLTHDESRRAVEVAECFADGLATSDEMSDASYFAEPPTWVDDDLRRYAAADLAYYLVSRDGLLRGFDDCQFARAAISRLPWPGGWLIRDIFGNPFRPVAVDPSWLTWRNAAVTKLAQTIYDDRRFDLLPILADALQEAGCTNADILQHCHAPGPHVRGCWGVDLLLGKA
jgi:hypothetical protein